MSKLELAQLVGLEVGGRQPVDLRPDAQQVHVRAVVAVQADRLLHRGAGLRRMIRLDGHEHLRHHAPPAATSAVLRPVSHLPIAITSSAPATGATM